MMLPTQVLDHQLELVSIHIPKTGGTSFQQYLVDRYGRGMQRLDVTITGDSPPRLKAKNKLPEEVLTRLFSGSSVPSEVRVLHGHFCYGDIRQLIRLDKRPAIISWLRHPVERTISNYFYLKSQLDDLIEHRGNSRKLMNRLMRSLPEFAQLPRQRQLYQRYLGGLPIEQYNFVGIIEDMDEEIKLLARQMGWRNSRLPHLNKTRLPKAEISREERQALEEVLQGEIQLYESALRWRDKGRPKNATNV
ncbi:MAG: sulfotransferase family 2 domain-containing protein [Bacteroidota bacterium]